jgi:hypothetical protein
MDQASELGSIRNNFSSLFQFHRSSIDTINELSARLSCFLFERVKSQRESQFRRLVVGVVAAFKHFNILESMRKIARLDHPLGLRILNQSLHES